MKIYLAGSCSKQYRHRMTVLARELRGKNYEVYCPFELKIENAWDYPQETWAQMVFDKDISAIDECDFVVMVSEGRMSSAGTNFEQGYAYAKGKPVFVFQYNDSPASLMTYCGSTMFLDWLYGSNGDSDLAVAEYIAQFPFEDIIKNTGKYPGKEIGGVSVTLT